MKVSVGIDLGTTNSVVGYMNNGKIEYIKFRNKESLPSVVLYQDGKYTVGEKARKKSVLYPANYIKSSKTYLGDFDKVWDIEDKGITPTRVAKEILGEIRLAIKKEMSIDDGLEVVITVPAYFTSSQIDETKKAAEIAGYEVKQIITEPVAAALAYGFEDALDQKIFIVDIGGGTFDTAILEVSNRDFNTLSIGGDNKLGGDDFDNVILELFLKHIRIDEGVNLASHEKSDLEESVYYKAYHMLTMKAEEVKIELSEHEDVEVSIANLFDDYNFEMKLSRSDFDSASYDILEKIKSEIEKTIDDSGLDIEEIDKVVLVGGSARIPAIREYVIDVFNTTPYADKPLDKLVAMGATIAVTDENTVQIRDIISHTLGTELVGDIFAPIIPKNTRYPVSMSEVYTTASDYQSGVSVGVYEGEDKNVNNNTYYGGFTLSDIEYAKKGVPKIKVTFSFDRNRILQVTAQDMNTNSSKSETIEVDHEAKKKVGTREEPFDIVLLMDVSGSMFGPPLNKAKEAARALSTKMIDLSMHRIGIVAFGSYAEKLVGLSNDEQDLLYAIDSLRCTGSTNMAAGIEKANINVLDDAKNKKLIILVTDGHPDSSLYAEREADNAKMSGTKIVTIGIGNTVANELLRKIASSDDDHYEGGDFDELSNIFQEITDSLQHK